MPPAADEVCEVIITAPDPDWLVEFTRRLLHTSDGPIVVATARDLTERLKAEERQAALLKYQERASRFGQAALAQREPAELIEKAVQEALEALDRAWDNQFEYHSAERIAAPLRIWRTAA